MRAAAYSHADGGPVLSPELEMWQQIQTYGAQAVYGRPMGAGEIRHINKAREVYGLYIDRQNAENWSAWAKQNRYGNRVLTDAMKAARDYGWLTNE